MKCRTCKLELDPSKFSVRNDTKSLTTACQSCEKKRKRKYYDLNKSICIERANVKKKETRHLMKDLIKRTKDVPCQDCGVKYPSYVMDFDHIHDKIKMINDFVRNAACNQLVEELKKCEVVCANCHRQRTYDRNQYQN